MAQRTARHLLTLWNPSYADSIMDAHLDVLLSWAERCGPGGVEEDDLYVWWAKIKSPNRQQPLPHISEILELQQQIEAGEETHLYLTDYRSLYVADLDEITDEDVLEETPDEIEHMPSYYRGKQADFWFRLNDIRLLVADDTVGVIEELKKLRNERYHGRPVSLYGGMVELPLIVSRDQPVTWFGDTREVTGQVLWAQQDAALRGATEKMAEELRDNLIGRKLWIVLEPSTRNFLATAEAVFRARRNDPRFDFSAPGIEYAKAVETELNSLLFPLLRHLLRTRPPAEREVRVDARVLDLGGHVPHQTIGALRKLLRHEATIRTQMKKALSHESALWMCEAVPDRLSLLAELRNPSAHGGRASREAISDLRDEVLGIGTEGLITKLATVKERHL